MTKGQCVRSLLAGITAIALAGCLAGAVAGQLFAGRAGAAMASTKPYDTRYSNGAPQEDEDGHVKEEVTYLIELDWRVAVASGGAVFLFTLSAALLGICGNLRQEPLKLLTLE